MFCYQCEQTAKGLGCDKLGVCGKQPDVSDLQDLLVYVLTGLGQAAVAAKADGVTVPLETGRFFAKAMRQALIPTSPSSSWLKKTREKSDQ